MQTFLPYPSFRKSAQVLDRQRLGKQRVEAWQILCAIESGGGWSNHPATRMWSLYTGQLALYGIAMCDEWRSRGYLDTMRPRFVLARRAAGPEPHWLGDPAFHAAHRSNLLRKAPAHYQQFGWAEPDDLPYIWPPATRSPASTIPPAGLAMTRRTSK